MSNTNLTKSEIKTLKIRLATYEAEYKECKTEAQRKCVAEAICQVRVTLQRNSWT